jgi:polyketide cyclase/dehydrase/lipid transport protein
MPYSALLERTVPLSRDKFFAQLADFGGIQKFVPDEVESVELAGDGIGAVRTVRMKGMSGELKERLESLVDQRLLSYSIINDTPLPFDRYHAVVEVEDAAGGGCKVRWGSNWIAKGTPESEVRKLVVDLYNRIIDGILRVTS